MSTSVEDLRARLRASKQEAEVQSQTHVTSLRDQLRQSAVPSVDEALQTRKTAAQSALPVNSFQVNGQDVETPDVTGQAAIDVGFQMTRIPEGIKQMQLQSEVNRLQGVVDGNPSELNLGMGESIDYGAPTLADREKAKVDLDAATLNLEDFQRTKTREAATYEFGTEGREKKALVGQLIGGMLSAPVPGVGPAKTGQGILSTVKAMSGRAATEGSLAASLSGMEFVPEGLDKEDQMLFSLLLGGALRGGIDTLAPSVKNLLGRVQGKKMTPEEAQEILAIAKMDSPETALTAKMMSKAFDPEFQNKQLNKVFSPEEYDGLPEVMKERLAVFAYMDTEPTRGQVFRDPQMMKEEIQIAGTRAGDELDLRFREQKDAGERKLLEITGQNESNLGADVKNTFDTIASDWGSEWSQLYDQAAKTSNPDARFNIDSLSASIIKNRNNLAINDSQKSLAAIRNVNDMLQQRLDIPDAELVDLKKALKAEHGNDAMIEVSIMNELVKRNGGLNAVEGNEVIKTFNRIKNPSGTDKQIIKEMREGLLADTIDGIGVDGFKQARESFSQFYKTIEEFPIAKRLGLDGSGNISEQDVMAKLIMPSGKIEDFRQFMSLLDQPRFQDVAPQIKESMRDSIFTHLREKSLKGPIKAGMDSNDQSFSPKQFIKALDSLSSSSVGTERLKALLTPEEMSALATVKRYGQLLEEPSVNVTKQNASGTAIQTVAGAISFLNKNPIMRGLSGALIATNNAVGQKLETMAHRKRLQGFGVPSLLQEAQRVASPVDPWFKQMVGTTGRVVPQSGVRATQTQEPENDKKRLAEEIVRNNRSVY